MGQEQVPREKKARQFKLTTNAVQVKHRANETENEVFGLSHLQNHLGNRALQRLLAQRSDDSPFDLDDATAERINRARGGGQSLDSGVVQQMGAALGHNFSGVRAHTSAEADELNQQLGAKAFTTGQDIFFREGAYQPESGEGRELIAHELTHVVQQSTGAVGGGGSGMTVNAPGDVFEQEADTVAKTVVSGGAGAEVQRQAAEEDDLQMQPAEEDKDEELA
ncbi:MAG: hypothetical protein DPW09_21065 [Anaerolineae bacterium]|nr:hypothetical protein [Anaerolineae bacterium]